MVRGPRATRPVAAINFYKYLFESGTSSGTRRRRRRLHDVFTRLNVGRIPLTDAELVKALLLTRSRSEVVNAREIAAQWDTIERDLRVPEFWAFVTGRPSGGDAYQPSA